MDPLPQTPKPVSFWTPPPEVKPPEPQVLVTRAPTSFPFIPLIIVIFLFCAIYYIGFMMGAARMNDITKTEKAKSSANQSTKAPAGDPQTQLALTAAGTFENPDKSVSFIYTEPLKALLTTPGFSVTSETKDAILARLQNEKSRGPCTATCVAFGRQPGLLDKQFSILADAVNSKDCQLSDSQIRNINTNLVLWSGGTPTHRTTNTYQLNDGTCTLKIIEADGYNTNLSNLAYKIITYKNGNYISIRLPLYPRHIFSEVDSFLTGLGFTQDGKCTGTCSSQESITFSQFSPNKFPTVKVISAYDIIANTITIK
jgi:hypothetical protein